MSYNPPLWPWTYRPLTDEEINIAGPLKGERFYRIREQARRANRLAEALLNHQGELMHVPFIGSVFDALRSYRGDP